MTYRVLAVATLSFVAFAFGCASKVEKFERELGMMVPDNTAQKREAVVLVNRAYEVYYDDARKEEARVREAAGMLEEAIRLDPGFATAHLNLGVLHLEQDNLPTAITRLRTAQRLMPGDSRPSYHLGVAYYRLRRSELAIEAYQTAIRIDQSDLRAVRGLAAACRTIHYADDSTLEVLERAQMMEPNEEWRRIIDREIIRQQRQLDMK